MSVQAVRIVNIVESLLVSNDKAAGVNREWLENAGVLAINLMSSPGAGKTSLILRTIAALGERARIGVIEGDIAGSIDTEKVLAGGAGDAIQINTGGNCHLEANMVHRALDDLDLTTFDILVIENVGNLVCPTHWALGEHLKLCLVGAAEGHDKPIKYLIDFVDFDRSIFYESIGALNPGVPIFEVSCRTGEGIEAWADWLDEQLVQFRKKG
jgi:hydrogenase nickel incorporation protein HypB